MEKNKIKKILSTLLSVLFCAITFAQSVRQGINYQAVARDTSGTVLINQALTIQFSVISDITNGFICSIYRQTNNYVRAVRAF